MPCRNQARPTKATSLTGCASRPTATLNTAPRIGELPETEYKRKRQDDRAQTHLPPSRCVGDCARKPGHSQPDSVALKLHLLACQTRPPFKNQVLTLRVALGRWHNYSGDSYVATAKPASGSPGECHSVSRNFKFLIHRLTPLASDRPKRSNEPANLCNSLLKRYAIDIRAGLKAMGGKRGLAKSSSRMLYVAPPTRNSHAYALLACNFPVYVCADYLKFL